MSITKDSMSKVNGESVNTMDTLKALAKEMESKTAYSASDCAEALNYLALAGYDTQQMRDTLSTVLNLAAAGGIHLASASYMVTDTMSAWAWKYLMWIRWLIRWPKLHQADHHSLDSWSNF